MSSRPSDVKYTKTHEWIRVKGAEATVGITDFAVEHLGDLVFVDLPEVGRTVEARESAAEVESVKAVGEVYAPAAGEIVAVNEALSSDTSPLATDPFGKGWLFRIRLAGAIGGDLLDRQAYEAQLASEGAGH